MTSARADDAILLSRHHHRGPDDDQNADHDHEMLPPPLAKTLTPAAEHDPFFKTRLCSNFTSKGFCGYAQGCTFAHGVQDLRTVNPSSEPRSSRVCKMYLRSGDCSYGANCTYLHVHKSDHCSRMPRTGNPCFGWTTTGRCSYGDHCRFIHAHPPPQGSSVEAGGHKSGGSEGSSRSKCNFSFKSTMFPSRLKKGSEKLNEMKKVDGIYGDWLE